VTMTEWSMRATEWVGMHAPPAVGRGLAELVLRYRYERMASEREMVGRNLSRVFGLPAEDDVVRAATREAFSLYGRYWYETFALRSMSFEEVNRLFRPTGVEHIDAGLSAGHGVIVALPHMGNWDAAGHWLAVNGYPVVAVAEELRPAAVSDLFYRHRRALGMQIVPLQKGVGERLSRLLTENRVIALLSDRNIGRRGVSVDFFGEPASLPAGPALLAKTTGAALLPVVVYTQDQGWTCTVEPPLDAAAGGRGAEGVRATMTELARRFELGISAAPADWHMFQPVWEADLAERGEVRGGGARVAA
jgi:phosphatidylinositol dimannoside acyltransferase